ncbi:SDR family NAD(P)-dependent oxidoreductase [Nonomuraea mangrovi]|uniref:SDR family NAD(P)-dependent oxidoreductase n=1 Tax=Nonomuraea mangrovi TaxID=2316207 RepID=A0ABW4TB47_9ACTN
MDVLGDGEIRRFLTERISSRCATDDVDPDRPLEEYGLSSRDAMGIAGELAELVGRELPPTLVWEHPTINRLAAALSSPGPLSDLADDRAPEPHPTGGRPSGPRPHPVEGRSSYPHHHSVEGRSSGAYHLVEGRSSDGYHLVEGRSHEARPHPVQGRAPEPIAVVGVGCRLPGAEGPEAFWDLLVHGRDAVRTVPEGRWERFDDGTARTAEALRRTTRHGGFLDDIEGFDAEFFGIPPGEAATMDPQQRLLLETAWDAFEHGGIAPRSLRGSRTACFVGISGNEYAHLTTADPASVEAWTATGAAFSIAANRLSYLLDLRGPSMAVDTACSSSLVAIHLAVNSLRAGESDLALAAGVNLLLSPVVTMAFDQAGGTAPDGRCKAFDASADGMVRAEGCGAVVLKRLSDALRDNDRVLAVVTASAVNQDGRSNGLVAPNPDAQRDLLRGVYADLDRGPDHIEAHGTGTFLGDPIEARAIAAALPCPVLIGSVKTNLGHLEAAAGVTGFIKSVLSLHHGLIPPSLHVHTPNPHVPWESLTLVTEPTPWPRPDARAGVSSFGFGGTNAHIVLDAHHEPATLARATGTPRARVLGESTRATGTPPARVLSEGSRTTGTPPARVLVLSDTSADRVREQAADLAAWLTTHRDPSGGSPDSGAWLGDVAYTLARRAGRGRVGAAVVGRTADELVRALATVEPGPAGGKGPVWVFSGYGAQWPGMVRDLYAAEPVFREAVDELAPLLKAEGGIDPHDREASGVAHLQPMIFAVQIALSRLWTAYGIRPAAVIGHSMGEVAAAVVAGGLGLHDGVRVICRRARLLGSLGGGGSMAVLEVAAEEVPAGLHVAVHSSPAQTVVTGDADGMARFAAEVGASGRYARVLTAEGAGHSPQVRPLQPLLRAELEPINPRKPSIPFYSTVLDDPRETPTFEPAYWAAGIRRPVRLMQAVRAAAEDGHTVFTEIGPHPVLAAPLRDSLPRSVLVTHSIARPPSSGAGPAPDGQGEGGSGERGPGVKGFEEQVARVAAAVPPCLDGRVVDVPRPRWRRERHWVAERPRTAGGHPVLGAHVETPAGDSWSPVLDDLSEAPWHLDEATWHRQGVAVLPVEAVARLALAASGGDVVEDVALYALLPLPARVTVTRVGGRVEVHAKDAAGVWKMYGSAGEGGSADARERIGLFRVDGSCEGIETREIQEAGVPVRLADKLVERLWTPAPLADDQVAPAREWLILADEGDPRAGRLASFLPAGPEGDPLLLVPVNPDPASVLLDLARMAGGRRLRIVTERAQAVVAGEPGEPAAASLRGVIRVLALEHPELRASLIDVDDLSALARELACDSDDDEVAWRGGVRYAARLRRAELPEPARHRGVPAVVREGGGYLITGGYGTLGLLVARWLAERGAGRVVVNGRSGPSAEAAAHLAGLPAVEVVTGDLAAEGTAARLVAAATEGGLRLCGVVHAAGALDDSLVADLTRASIERVWAAKATGGRRLDEATRGHDLDWWVAFSSAASLLGSPGQAAYVMANAYLDALCDLRRAEGAPAVSIAWGTWAGANPLPAVVPLTPEEGIEALEALLRRGLSAGVVRLDPAKATAVFPGVGRMPYFSMVVEGAGDRRPDLGELAPEEALRVIGARVRERVAGVLGLDARWLEESGDAPGGTVLTDLGLDSLAATRLRGSFEHDFGVALPAGLLLRGGTLDGVVRALAAELGVERAGPVEMGPRDAAERLVVRVAGEVVGRVLGVNEAVPAEVLPALEREVGRRVAGVTVAEVADGVRNLDEKEAGRGIVRPLTAGLAPPGAHRGPLFLAHPAGGTTGVYLRLASLLGTPVFGLERVEGADGIPERAAAYAEAITGTCPAPYRIGGWSFGGIMAFEIARLLGDAVELVAMIDSGLPAPLDPAALTRVHARRYADFSQYLRDTYGAAISLTYDELAELGESEQLALTEARIEASGVLTGLSPAILRHQRTSHQDTLAIERYQCGPYQGRVVLYRSTEPTPWAVEDVRYAHTDDPARGFAPFAKNLEIVPVHGSHHLNLLDPPHVEIVAAHLRGLL